MTIWESGIMAEIRVPTLGESVTEATIGRWFKQAGEAVAVDEPLVELETDKVTTARRLPCAGYRPKAESIPRRCRVPARTDASPRETCWRRRSGPRRSRR